MDETFVARGVVAAVVALSAAGCSADSAPDAELSGRLLYATNGCAACHGQAGKGDGPIAKTLTPPPRDFRDGDAFKNGADAASVARTIAAGFTRDGGQMQGYGHLSEGERLRLAEYVLSLREPSAQ